MVQGAAPAFKGEVRRAVRGPRPVGPQRAAHGARDRCDFMRVGQARPVVISALVREHLHLAAQAAKRRTVQYAIAIALKRTSIRMFGLGVLSAPRVDAAHGIGREQPLLALRDGPHAFVIATLTHRRSLVNFRGCGLRKRFQPRFGCG